MKIGKKAVHLTSTQWITSNPFSKHLNKGVQWGFFGSLKGQVSNLMNEDLSKDFTEEEVFPLTNEAYDCSSSRRHAFYFLPKVLVHCGRIDHGDSA